MATATNFSNRTNGAGAAAVRTSAVGNVAIRRTAAERYRMLTVVLAVGLICFLMVMMSAVSANLERSNDELRTDNAYIQADIDTLNDRVGESTNINRIEDVATKKLGMIHPDANNCINVDGKTSVKTDLAKTIKTQAYA